MGKADRHHALRNHALRAVHQQQLARRHRFAVQEFHRGRKIMNITKSDCRLHRYRVSGAQNEYIQKMSDHNVT